jgi:hypothetical protein
MVVLRNTVFPFQPSFQALLSIITVEIPSILRHVRDDQFVWKGKVCAVLLRYPRFKVPPSVVFESLKITIHARITA